jgi:HEAT repeat protein
MNQNRIPGKRLILFSGNWVRSSPHRNVPHFSWPKAKKEKNKYVLATLLDALGHVSKPSDLDLTPVYALLADERWLVRHSAIQSLKRTSSPQVEDMILHVLETTSDPYDLVYCQATLNQIGSVKAIPFIAKNLKSRKRDVKDSARLAIEAIEARERRNAPR